MKEQNIYSSPEQTQVSNLDCYQNKIMEKQNEMHYEDQLMAPPTFSYLALRVAVVFVVTRHLVFTAFFAQKH